jgi:hypothetical protein
MEIVEMSVCQEQWSRPSKHDHRHLTGKAWLTWLTWQEWIWSLTASGKLIVRHSAQHLNHVVDRR